MESLRYLPWLSKDGWLITNTKPFVNFPKYPDINLIIKAVKNHPNHIALDADQIAKDLGSPKSANMVVLGAAIEHLDIEHSIFENSIRTLFKNKGEETIKSNISALNAGSSFAKTNS